MAINIFQGGKEKKASVNSASNSQRAQQAKAAVSAPSETSNSGATAVKTQGTLAKVGDAIGKVAGLASKFLPGIGGTIAGAISNILNDPEWWQSVPGHAVTVNAPLKPVPTGTRPITQGGSEQAYAKTGPLRTVLAEFVAPVTQEPNTIRVISTTKQMVTAYLMSEIRKVVNAIPLQSADDYQYVFEANATLYALWRQLRKIDYMLKHGQTYVPNMNVQAYPILQVTNAAWLQSTIGRLEEALRASVRLPHTLCCYLAWRFGRTYRSTSSAKAALIQYNVLPLTASISDYESVISELLSAPSSTTARQQANTDLYNAYYDHDLLVVIRDDTQFLYDKKEWMLRTNLDVREDYESSNCVYIDSDMDNPTTFMASTVSTTGSSMDGEKSLLFPVSELNIYGKVPDMGPQTAIGYAFLYPDDTATPGANTSYAPQIEDIVMLTDGWYKWRLPKISLENGIAAVADDKATYFNAVRLLTALAMLKTMDIYNKELYVMYSFVPSGFAPYDQTSMCIDVSSMSMDLGLVTDSTLGNEHVFAFANLVDIKRKSSTTYHQAEKEVAKETANLIDKLDVGSVPTSK